MIGAEAITPGGLIDRCPISARQLIVLALALAITMSDGADLQLLAFAAPAILADWGVSKLAFTPALSAALVGMIAGASLGGYLGDRFGRKTILLGSVVLMGGATIGTGLASNVGEMTVMRFAAGVGFGATTPTAYALGVEALPHRSRTWASALLSLINAVGGMLGSLIALVIIPDHGWRMSFHFSGGISLALGLLILLFVPESASYLASRGRRDKALSSLRRILGSAAVPPELPLVADRSGLKADEGAASVRRSVFSRAFARTTVGAWLIYFATAFVAYACINWLPTIMTNNRWSFDEAVQLGGIMNVSAIAGSLFVVLVAHRTGTKPLLLVGAAAIGMAALAIPFLIVPAPDASRSFAGMAGAGILLGYAAGSLMSANLAVVGNAYPVGIRSRGVGYALSMARLGSAVSTLVAGAILYYTHDDLWIFFGVIGAVAALVALGAQLVDRHVDASGFRAGPASAAGTMPRPRD